MRLLNDAISAAQATAGQLAGLYDISTSPSLSRSAVTAGGCAPTWSARTFYSPGDVVSHNGANWTSLWWTTGAKPGTPIPWNVWTDDGSC